MNELVSAYYVIADGQKYGPFHTRNEEKIERLFHKKGIEIEYVMVPKGEIVPKRKKPRKKAENMKLDFTGWIPIAKG